MLPGSSQSSSGLRIETECSLAFKKPSERIFAEHAEHSTAFEIYRKYRMEWTLTEPLNARNPIAFRSFVREHEASASLASKLLVGLTR